MYPRPKTRSRPRKNTLARLLSAAVAAAVAILVLRTWYVEGLVVPLRIVGGSMAETLYGAHRQITCSACGHHFRCDAARESPDRIACAACGSPCLNVRQLPVIGGDRVLVQKAAFCRKPRRWELVAFRRNGHPGTLAVKRVVGLPGERIEIRSGDVYIDGHVARKTLAQQKAVALPVAVLGPDTARQPASAAHWVPQDADSGWSVSGGGLHYRKQSTASRIDWMWYEHRQPLVGNQPANNRPTAQVVPITNTMQYNAAWPQRAEHRFAVYDLMLSMRLEQLAEPGKLAVAIGDGKQQFCIHLVPAEGAFRVLSLDEQLPDGRPTPIGGGRLPARWSHGTVDVSLFDRQMLLAVDGRVLFTWELPSPAPQGGQATGVLGIGTDACSAAVSHVAILRDIYYFFHHDGSNLAIRPVQLGEDQYYVLGDNPLLSDDSRTWIHPQEVDSRAIVGWPFAAVSYRLLRLGNLDFQVPDLGTLRYIR